MIEHRQFHRVFISLVVKLKYADGRETESFTGTLGAGGVFIQVFNPLPVGHEVTIEMHLPGSEEKTLLTGKIVWTRNEFADEHPPGMGLKFVNIPRKVQVIINEMVLKILEGREEEG